MYIHIYYIYNINVHTIYIYIFLYIIICIYDSININEYMKHLYILQITYATYFILSNQL